MDFLGFLYRINDFPAMQVSIYQRGMNKIVDDCWSLMQPADHFSAVDGALGMVIQPCGDVRLVKCAATEPKY